MDTFEKKYLIIYTLTSRQKGKTCAYLVFILNNTEELNHVLWYLLPVPLHFLAF